MHLYAIVSVLIYVGVLLSLLPKHVLLRGDDFGYVESVVATLQSGALRASDWLEPLNLPLTLISSGVFHFTGNFYLSTFGVGALIALVNYAFLRAWLRPALPVELAGEIIILATALSPIWLNKTLEFTGVPLSLTCFLVAMLAWRRGNWNYFFMAALVGFAQRQSAICLLVFPLLSIVRSWQKTRRVDILLLVRVIGFLIAASAILFFTPPTFARLITATQFTSTFSGLTMLGNVFLAAVVLAGWRAVWDIVCGASALKALSVNLKQPLWPLLLSAAGAFVVFSSVSVLNCETPGVDRFAKIALIFSTFVGAWFGRGFRDLPAEAHGYFTLFGGLVAFRGIWWDYYFLEPMIMLAGLSNPQIRSDHRVHWQAWTGLGVTMIYVALLKQFLVAVEQKNVTYEKALRDGQITINEASDASFGFLGWKLFHCARARGVENAKLIDFMKYVEGERGSFSRGTILINPQGGHGSLHPSGERWELPKNYKERAYPLTNDEWRILCDENGQ